MELNTFLFRAPDPSYSYLSFENELIWIPATNNTKIPCLFLPSPQGNSRTFLYFHANAEDLGQVYDFLDVMRCALDVNILAPEYPGYGIYPGEATCNKILTDGLVIYKFMQRTLEIDMKDLVIIGRSIGSGPASWLASQGTGALILLSPYTSIRKAVRGLIGSILQYIVKDQFKNIEYMSKVTCPTLFIHGRKDNLISYKHSYKLAGVCLGKFTVFIPENMTHNEFKYFEDIFIPIDCFLREHELEISVAKTVKVPENYYQTPREAIFHDLD